MLQMFRYIPDNIRSLVPSENEKNMRLFYDYKWMNENRGEVDDSPVLG
jgi:hypothetical protein